MKTNEERSVRESPVKLGKCRNAAPESQGAPELLPAENLARICPVLAALVLAAGGSTRMGSAKALLPAPDGRIFVVRVIDTLIEAGLVPVIVVTGIHHDPIVKACRSHLEGRRARIVQNPDPSQGQLSSLLVGMDAAVTPGAEGVLVTLVDVPMVLPKTVRAVVDAWRRTRAPIVRPAIGDRHGHPVIFDAVLFDALRSAPLEVGAKAVVRANESRIENVPVDDPGCLIDVDTPGDFARLG